MNDTRWLGKLANLNVARTPDAHWMFDAGLWTAIAINTGSDFAFPISAFAFGYASLDFVIIFKVR